MPPFAYSVKIDRKYKTINYQETHEVENDVLTIAQLRKLGVSDNDSFWVREDDHDIHNDYILVVDKHRLETKAERHERVMLLLKYNRYRKSGRS